MKTAMRKGQDRTDAIQREIGQRRKKKEGAPDLDRRIGIVSDHHLSSAEGGSTHSLGFISETHEDWRNDLGQVNLELVSKVGREVDEERQESITDVTLGAK